MASLLETLITFVVAMLVLALAAQSVQELIKVAFALKGRVALKALRGLVREAAEAHQQMPNDGDDILAELIRRLQALGQKGFGKSGIRLDSLSAEQLQGLIAAVDPAKIAGLKALEDGAAKTRLAAIARQACVWFPLAMNPVDTRYRRRMRFLAFVTSALVVLGLNAGAIDLLRQTMSDPALRARMGERGERLLQLDSLIAAVVDSVAVRAQAPDSQQRHTETLRTRLDSLTGVRAGVTQAGLEDLSDMLTGPAGWHVRSLEWWVGILFSTLLVSFGAPFWHDVLESLFGVKQMLRSGSRGRDPREGGAEAEEAA